MPAVIAALGGPAGSPGILTLPRSRAVALLLVDGLGSELLRAHAADAPFLSSLTELGPLTAGFPSSTVVSLASLGTGLPPGAHGLVGTSLRVGRDVLDALHWRKHTPRGRDLRKTLIPEDVQPYPTAFEQAVTACIGVTSIGAAAFQGSGLTRAALRGGTFRGVYAMGDLAAEMITALQRPGPQLVYGYHADLDMLGHGHGPGALPWRLQLRQIDGLAALVAEALPPDAVLLVTAHHGMVAVDRTFDADTHPDLRRNVSAVAGTGAPGTSTPSPARRRTCSRHGDRCSATRAGWRRASRRSRRAGSARSDRTWRAASATWSWPPAAQPPSPVPWPSR